MNYFTYNGHNSSEYGLVIEHSPEYGIPERYVERIEVPGRNGDLVIDYGVFANVDQVYHVYFDGRSSSFAAKAQAAAQWLMSSRGYMRLEDTYDTTTYRMAMINQSETMNNFMNKLGRFDVVFTCKPQRFLKTGETETTLTIGNTGQTVTNNYMPCYPIFKLTGNGTLQVNGNYITVANNSGTVIWIDCEAQNAYNGITNMNNKITLDGEFPFLKSGTNIVKVTGFSAAKMVPRWWTV